MWRREGKTRIKLCEFETEKEVFESSALDIQAMGFHLFSKHSFNERCERFSRLFPLVPPHISKVLLTDVAPETLVQFCSHLPVDTIQLYPDWTAKKILSLREELPTVKILKVMSAQPSENFTPDYREFIDRYGGAADGILLDSFRRGGTGQTANWDHCAEIVEASPIPVFLAGGLNPSNVREAIRRVRPYGVDVETGVSDRLPSGRLVKNLAKCRRFVDAVREADEGLSILELKMESGK